MNDIDFEKAVIDANDEKIKKLVQETDKIMLAKALKASSPEVSGKIFQNMSVIESERIKTEMANMGAIRIQDVESAQETLAGQLLN